MTLLELLFILFAQKGALAAAQDPQRDPTRMAPEFQSNVAAASQHAAEPPRAATAAELLRGATIKALVIVRGRSGVAILEINGRLHHIGVGSPVAPAGEFAALRVVAISQDGVEVSGSQASDRVLLR